MCGAKNILPTPMSLILHNCFFLTVKDQLEVSELIPKKDNGVIKFKAVIKNQKGDVALEGEHVYLVKKRSI